MATRKVAKKKRAKKKALTAGPKSAAKKRPAPKKAVAASGKAPRKAAPQRPAPSPARRVPAKSVPVVEPGPPTVSAPPVEEPARLEEAVGIVTHYYSHLGVAVVQLNKGALRTGDRIRIHGHSSDFTQAVGSMECEHQHVDRAEAGQCVGLKVFDHAREHDIVYLIR